METVNLRQIINTATTLTEVVVVAGEELLFEGPAHVASTELFIYSSEPVMYFRIKDNKLIIKINSLNY